MLNQIILVGRIVNNGEIKEEGEKKKATYTLAVSRTFKNSEGIYETDLIPCVLYDKVASSAIEYCKQGDLVGIKGRIQSNNGKIEIIAEKLTFLTSKKED